MNTGLLHLHNFLRWVILILLLVSIVKAYTGWKQKKVFSPGDKKVWLFTMISSHITFLIGLYLLFFGRFGIAKGLPEGVSLMKNKYFRFLWVEHPLGMLLALVLVALAHGMAKKQVPDAIKYKKAFYFFIVALILILASIPWPFREVVGKPWFPGM